MTTTADCIAQALRDEGIERVYGLPGEQTDALLLALEDADIDFIAVRHEQAAAMMAVGDARLTGRPAVCLATVGPGALNLATGLATATLDGVPIVAISAQVATDKQHRTYHQRIDTLSALAPTCVYSAALRVPDTASEAVRLAFAEARRQGGAAHLEVAPDVAEQSAEPSPTPRPSDSMPIASPDTLDTAQQLLASAERPVVVAGREVLQANASNALVAFAHGLGAPILTTLMGKGIVPFDDSHALGVKGFGFRDFPDLAIEQADAVVTVGIDPNELDANGLVGPSCRRVVHIGTAPAPVLDGFPVDVSVVGDIGHSLRILASSKTQPLWCPSIQQAWRDDLRKRGECSVCHPGIVRSVQEAAPDNAIVLGDVGSHKQWIARTFDVGRAQDLMLSNGLASMGVGLPMAIGAAMTAPTRPVVLINGDGGFWMNGAELETAVRLGVHLVAVVLTDEHFGLIRLKQQNDNVPVTGTTFGPVDVARAADAFGATGVHCTDPDSVSRALATALDTPGVTVISVAVQSERDIEHIEAIAKAVDALATKLG